ncbi:MAG: hypothetical protein IH591_13860 [Bacteroidales bacterium]|nr:hypothetical protein [Bacteroidales bacterium]
MNRITYRLSAILAGAIIIVAACNDSPTATVPPGKKAEQPAEPGFIRIATDINYDVIVIPPVGSDPWESERVSGYDGSLMVDDIFKKIYEGTMVPYDLVTGEPIAAEDVKKIEKEMGSDRSLIAKLQFTEDWYYNPDDGEIRKIVKSVTLGYEFRDSMGNMFGYKALFRLVLAE